ncbi:hypothetical protein JM93_04044 [Roseibium hamelinense]|uniref:DUF1254 domain-containing protein n=1 Tax=Roseibium hamelinense TaxID=150831 RepID=A0A562SHQ1_9HYPH|nr:DUF1254 domain-containing protein [Roseibium hamelinense]MTI43877.1 DUF1254 domain-containing protein [Roseibium hamelinense]TWI80829.1 hypothetical protein JM93_04044 [Roseibium hamelinense]
MKRTALRCTTALTALCLALAAAPSAAQDAAAPMSPLVDQLNDGNWLDQDEAEALRDELFYQRAVHAYMTMLPALNVIGMRDGSEAAFGAGYNVLPIWKDRMDSRTLVTTPNADVIYSMNYLDLGETGPLVVAAPPGVIGMFTDFFQRTITDVGAIGPDRARGGLYLLLPPNYDGHVPDGYFTFESSTNNVFLFFRTVMEQGDGVPDPAPAVARAEQTRIYPLWEEEKNIPPMEFPNASGQRVYMMYPVDNDYWTKLKDFVDEEPVTAITPELRGVLASIGIIKGEPFEPTEREQELLLRAVETAPRMILATKQLGRDDERNLYYDDRQYERAWSGATAEFMQESYLDIDQRAGFFSYAYSSAPAMVMRTIGAGSKYPLTARDADGEFLSGEHTYRMRLPADPPAALFWAVTAYNITDGTMPETEQLLPSKNGYYDVDTNEDGSIDIWFAPEQPEGGADTNFIQTIPGRNFMAAVRLYGAEIEFYDQTWKPDDIVKVE